MVTIYLSKYYFSTLAYILISQMSFVILYSYSYIIYSFKCCLNNFVQFNCDYSTILSTKKNIVFKSKQKRKRKLIFWTQNFNTRNMDTFYGYEV